MLQSQKGALANFFFNAVELGGIIRQTEKPVTVAAVQVLSSDPIEHFTLVTYVSLSG